jgi:hypothetical protein
MLSVVGGQGRGGCPLEVRSIAVPDDHGHFPGILPQFGMTYTDIAMSEQGLTTQTPHWVSRMMFEGAAVVLLG